MTEPQEYPLPQDWKAHIIRVIEAITDPDQVTSKAYVDALFALVSGALVYQGTWNASTNTPTLADGTGTKGHYYLVTVPGTQDLGSGNITFTLNDRVVHNGTAWQKWDAEDLVVSVFGRVGVVVANAGDYTASQVTNIPAGTVAAVTVQAAINELDTEKLAIGASAGGDLGGAYPSPTVNNGADGSAIHEDIADEIHQIAGKATPVNADAFLMEDSADATPFAKKEVTWSDIKATLKTYFDTLYATLGDIASAISTHAGLSDAHHNKSHAHNGSDGSGTVAHSDTTGRTASDHHARYLDAEAVSAMGGKADGNPLNHDRPVQATESIVGIAEIATQAETNTGTDDTRIVTPLKLKTSPLIKKTQPFGFDALGAGSTSYIKHGSIIFLGTTKEGSPSKIYVNAYKIGGTTYNIRIRDITNGQTIAEVTGLSNTTEGIQDLGTLSNLPAAQARWELQLQRVGVPPGNIVSSGGLIEW